jgi:hypothetical protein
MAVLKYISSLNNNPMKPLLSLFVLILLSVTCKAQMLLDDYYKQGTSWCEWESITPIKSPTLYRIHNYEISKDSVVNGKNYKLLKYSGHYQFSSGGDITTILGGIRISGDSVYFIRFYQFNIPNSGFSTEPLIDQGTPLGAEVVLYDFNVKVGDHMPWTVLKNTVTKIDSMSLPNGARVAVYRFSDDYPSMSATNFWIYGIGSSRGFIGPYAGSPYSKVVYYSNPVFSYYVDTQFKVGDCFPTNVNSIAIDEVFNIYPNPLTDNTLHITSIGIEKLNIVDVTGKIAYAISQLSSGEQSINIDIPVGIYILKAQLTDGTTQMRKIVRQ